MRRPKTGRTGIAVLLVALLGAGFVSAAQPAAAQAHASHIDFYKFDATLNVDGSYGSCHQESDSTSSITVAFGTSNTGPRGTAICTDGSTQYAAVVGLTTTAYFQVGTITGGAASHLLEVWRVNLATGSNVKCDANFFQSGKQGKVVESSVSVPGIVGQYRFGTLDTGTIGFQCGQPGTSNHQVSVELTMSEFGIAY